MAAVCINCLNSKCNRILGLFNKPWLQFNENEDRVNPLYVFMHFTFYYV